MEVSRKRLAFAYSTQEIYLVHPPSCVVRAILNPCFRSHLSINTFAVVCVFVFVLGCVPVRSLPPCADNEVRLHRVGRRCPGRCVHPADHASTHPCKTSYIQSVVPHVISAFSHAYRQDNDRHDKTTYTQQHSSQEIVSLLLLRVLARCLQHAMLQDILIDHDSPSDP